MHSSTFAAPVTTLRFFTQALLITCLSPVLPCLGVTLGVQWQPSTTRGDIGRQGGDWLSTHHRALQRISTQPLADLVEVDREERATEAQQQEAEPVLGIGAGLTPCATGAQQPSGEQQQGPITEVDSDARPSSDRADEQPGDSARQRPSVMRCTGTHRRDRACLFTDLFYDVLENKWAFHGPQAAVLPALGEDTSHPFLQMGRVSWTREGKQPDNLMHFEWLSADSAPAASETITVDEPVHLRAPFQNRSFGHLIRDNMQALVDVPMRFNQDPADFTWVVWPTNHPSSRSEVTRLMKHYYMWVSKRPFVAWPDFLQRTMARKDSGHKRYLRFTKLLAGWGGTDLFVLASSGIVGAGGPSCDSAPFQEMRRIAYTHHSIQHVPAAQLPETRVLFLSRTASERRGIVNQDEVLEQLRSRFPGVVVEAAAMTHKTPEEQMLLLSRTSVLVTNIGSASFRLVYLPDGGQVITIGACEAPITGADGNVYRAPNPFRESSSCWAHMGHVSMLNYRVRSLDETHQPNRTRARLDPRTQASVFYSSMLWDSSIVVNATALGDLVEVALLQLRL